MLSPQPSPCHPQSTFLLSSPSLTSPFFIPSSIPQRKFTVFATPNKKEKHDLYALKTTTKLQVQDFLETIMTEPFPQKPGALEKFQRNVRIQTISDFNHLLMSLISADEFELALNLKSSLSSFGLFPDNSTYSILVNCYCKKNEPTEAKTVLDGMLDNGFSPDVATFTTLINAFCRNGRTQDAFKVFGIMSEIKCVPTINTYNCLLKGLCYVGRVEEAYDLMEKIKESSIKPDVYTYTAVMDGLCKVGRSHEASELLNEALEMGLTPNAVTYNTLLNGFFKEGRPLCGFGLLKKMRERKCRPDYISYTTLFHGLLKWGKIKQALSVYKGMVEGGYQVDERMMNTLLRGLCRRSRKEKELLKYAYELFDEMKMRSYTIYADSYDLILEAFCIGREIRVFESLNDMVRLGYSPKTFTFNIIINVLCGAGEVDKALEVLMMMHKDRKATGTPFNVLIDELNRRERFLEACNVHDVALKRGVVPKSKPGRFLH